MIGQWCGNYTGTNNGFAILNIEEEKGLLCGALYLNDNLNGTPGLVCWILINKDLQTQTINQTQLYPINPMTFLAEEDKDHFLYGYNKLYPDYRFPEELIIELSFVDQSLNIKVKSNIGNDIEANLENKISACDSKLNATRMSWDEFKVYSSGVDYRQVVFRGQADIWPLRTSFHRNKRFDVIKYVLKDIPLLYGRSIGLTSHLFDLKNEMENGAFYSLLQHHGYPTPLLDWSYSPFVAAFFAFKNIEAGVVSSGNSERMVRIFVFDIVKWRFSYAQYKNITDCRLHVSVGEFLPINNARALPQQALTTYTNVYDIEGFIYEHGVKSDFEFLKTIDIPVSDYYKAMNDLSLMGMTASTLFPGIDGMCEEMKRLNFPHV